MLKGSNIFLIFYYSSQLISTEIFSDVLRCLFSFAFFTDFVFVYDSQLFLVISVCKLWKVYRYRLHQGLLVLIQSLTYFFINLFNCKNVKIKQFTKDYTTGVANGYVHEKRYMKQTLSNRTEIIQCNILQSIMLSLLTFHCTWRVRACCMTGRHSDQWFRPSPQSQLELDS